MRLSLRRTIAAALLAAVPVLTAAAASPASHASSPAPLRMVRNAIPGDYIVSLTPGTDPAAVTDRIGVRPRHVYRAALTGFAAPLTEAQLTQVRGLPAVTAVEQDSTVTVSPVEQRAIPAPKPVPGQRAGTGIPWGLERINQRTPGGKGFSVKATGAKVTAYVIDSGIDFTHPEFGGRATLGIDQIADGRNGVDCAGHGTHVAGTVGGEHTGVAKQVKLVAVRVLNCEARGPNSGIIAGINWVAANAKKPAVANLSLGGNYSATMNASLNGLANSGVFTVVAAGNGDTNACVISPASAAKAFTVAAIDEYDRKATFSNYGSCVNMNAPGTNITSTSLNGTYADMSGTSMATPHVTGIAVLYKDTYGDTDFATLSKWLTDNATPNVPIGAPWGTPRLLAYTGGL
ncbi:S8 family peptidase [Streptomyces sp. NBC_01537]|uniref:S8 family peptidase n=1 Tax=Streptomyces sp. NBC_01537 TaxID=2903896 RepID=UPI00386EAD9F